MYNKSYYPTPREVITKMVEPHKELIKTANILEPSAGMLDPFLIEEVSIHSFFTYRTDTNFVLGNRVGKGYTVVQNEEALSVADALVAEGGLIIETAGSLDEGRPAITVHSVRTVLAGGLGVTWFLNLSGLLSSTIQGCKIYFSKTFVGSKNELPL